MSIYQSKSNKAIFNSKHALMTTKWTCQRCAKPNTLMLMKAEDWDKANNVMCSNCHKTNQVRHRQRITVK